MDLNLFSTSDKKLAVEYALGHTNTRCHMMGKCQGNCPLGVRYCDFRSRYEAFLQGIETTMKILKNIPWDFALSVIKEYPKSIVKNPNGKAKR